MQYYGIDRYNYDTCNGNLTKWDEYKVYVNCLQIHCDCNACDEWHCCSCCDNIASIEQLIGYVKSLLYSDLSYIHVHSTNISSGGMISIIFFCKCSIIVVYICINYLS